ncbi:MAG: hypothetical protein MJ177_09410, partial [Clostridia bacterium]|nr:hypothetical protein [Clostridia bacterium]
LSDKPLVILDGGHNPGCADAVNGFFANSLSDKRTVILGAIMKDKDFEGTFGSLLSRCEQAIFTRAPLERCENPEILCRCAEEYGVKASCFEDCDTALKYALSVTDENGLLFICGSFYLAREIRNKFSSV